MAHAVTGLAAKVLTRRCTAMSCGTSTDVCRNFQSRACLSNADVPPSRGQLLVQLAEASRHFVWLSSPLASRGFQVASRLRKGVTVPLASAERRECSGRSYTCKVLCWKLARWNTSQKGT